jgi:hypothetical protein
MRKSVFYGGLTGITLGIVGSATLSPNKESIAPNIAVWGSLGALVGAALGYFFFMDDPENRELPSMMPTGGTQKNKAESLLSNFYKPFVVYFRKVFCEKIYAHFKYLLKLQ